MANLVKKAQYVVTVRDNKLEEHGKNNNNTVTIYREFMSTEYTIKTDI